MEDVLFKGLQAGDRLYVSFVIAHDDDELGKGRYWVEAGLHRKGCEDHINLTELLVDNDEETEEEKLLTAYHCVSNFMDVLSPILRGTSGLFLCPIAALNEHDYPNRRVYFEIAYDQMPVEMHDGTVDLNPEDVKGLSKIIWELRPV